jgi:hypothetical protein
MDVIPPGPEANYAAMPELRFPTTTTDHILAKSDLILLFFKSHELFQLAREYEPATLDHALASADLEHSRERSSLQFPIGLLSFYERSRDGIRDLPGNLELERVSRVAPRIEEC